MSAMYELPSANDLQRMTYPAWLALSEDGSEAAYSLFSPCQATGGFASTVHVIRPVCGGEESACFEGNIPQYDKQGRTLAYLSGKSGEKQVWLRNENGEHRQLTNLRHGVTSYCWSQDGKSIAFETPLWPEDMNCPFQTRSPAEKKAWLEKQENSPIIVEKLMYKFDGEGISTGCVSCIGLVLVEDGAARIITDGVMPAHSPAFSHDGNFIAFYGKPYTHNKANKNEVFLYDLRHDTLVKLTQDDMCTAIAPPVFTADDQFVIYAAYRGGDVMDGFLTRLFKTPVSGGTPVELMPAGDDVGVDNMPTARTKHGEFNPIFQISRDGTDLYYMAADRGTNNLYQINLVGDPIIKQVTTGTGSVHSYYPPTNGLLLFTKADISSDAQLYVRCADEEKCLTRLNPWMQQYPAASWEELWVDTKDGTAKIQGWIMKPFGYSAGKKYPAVLNVHGGPTCTFVRDFNLEFQAQAAAGFAVIFCNPRGSSGYGMAFTDGELAWGQVAIDDIYDYLDAAVAQGYIDVNRIGITGGSYGGYMTIKLIGRTKRFKAAVAQRALCNTTTSYGTGDMGFVSDDPNRPSMEDFLMDRVRTSYIKQIDEVDTPLLLLHGTADYRCSFEQAEQMFVAMKDRRPQIPVRMVAFPGESHGVSRSGRVKSQIVHMQEMVDWFTKYLKED